MNNGHKLIISVRKISISLEISLDMRYRPWCNSVPHGDNGVISCPGGGHPWWAPLWGLPPWPGARVCVSHLTCPHVSPAHTHIVNCLLCHQSRSMLIITICSLNGHNTSVRCRLRPYLASDTRINLSPRQSWSSCYLISMIVFVLSLTWPPDVTCHEVSVSRPTFLVTITFHTSLHMNHLNTWHRELPCFRVTRYYNKLWLFCEVRTGMIRPWDVRPT